MALHREGAGYTGVATQVAVVESVPAAAGTNVMGRTYDGAGTSTVNGATSAAALAATTVVADTGALAAGVYDLDIVMAILGVNAAGKGLHVEHRNAANNATVRILGGCPAGAVVAYTLRRITLANNERIRIISGAVALAASEVADACVAARLLPS